MSNNTENKQNPIVKVFVTLGGWLKRMFVGASKELTDAEKFNVENIESPSKMAVKNFFRRKLAVVALVVLVLMFLLVFIGPLFVPMSLNYTDAVQANIEPTMDMRSVPKGLKNNIKSISGYAGFTIGVSNDNTLYAWGATKDSLTKIDCGKFPAEIKKNGVVAAAAGADHVIAITTEGKVVGWGAKSRGQYGHSEELGVISMPDELINGTINANNVQQLLCSNQATALVVDGKLYLWGNANNITNMKDVASLELTNVKKVAFSRYKAIVLLNDGTLSDGNDILPDMKITTPNGDKVRLLSYIETNKVVDIAATDNCYAFLLENGELYVTGAYEYGENKIARIGADEKYIKIVAGAKHFIGLTNKGKAYGWGFNQEKQVSFKGVKAGNIFAGAKQTYITNTNGKLTNSYGLKGYPFGTDNRGRDVLVRIIHGGKMTMTIGAVAVIVSTIIAIIVGCLSGYFGGWVDMLLMRLTEIVSAIPFLPFAMLLSHVMTYTTISEDMRIFIIMLILGVLSWTGLAHMIRGQVLAEREKEYVLAGQAMGVKESKIAFKHILPNIISIILVSITLDFAGCLLTESSLSYLGFGVQLPRPTWGNMLNGAKNDTVIRNYWWQWVFPSIFLSIATISINIIGDTLRDVLDPKSSAER